MRRIGRPHGSVRSHQRASFGCRILSSRVPSPRLLPPRLPPQYLLWALCLRGAPPVLSRPTAAPWCPSSHHAVARGSARTALLLLSLLLWAWPVLVVGSRASPIPNPISVTSYVGVLIYLITQGRGMAERNAQHAQQARDGLRRAVGFSVADEIEKLDRLKKSGTITDQEFARLRAKLVET